MPGVRGRWRGAWDTGRASFVRKLRQQLGQGHPSNPRALTPPPQRCLRPKGKGTWLHSWGQSLSQSPDLTPTLESTGSEAMKEEGLSPNQTNKPKNNSPTQPCCFHSHQRTGLSWKSWDLESWKPGSGPYLIAKLSVLEQSRTFSKPQFPYLGNGDKDTLSKGGCKELGHPRWNSLHFMPPTLHVLSCYSCNNFPTQKKRS